MSRHNDRDHMHKEIDDFVFKQIIVKFRVGFADRAHDEIKQNLAEQIIQPVKHNRQTGKKHYGIDRVRHGLGDSPSYQYIVKKIVNTRLYLRERHNQKFFAKELNTHEKAPRTGSLLMRI